jgi:hypothetical protein
MLETTHAPTINARSERLAVQAQARQWADGNVHIAVEDRLIAAAPKEAAPEPLPEAKPAINPNSVKILARRGPVDPLEQRLAQSVRHVRKGVRRPHPSPRAQSRRQPNPMPPIALPRHTPCRA